MTVRSDAIRIASGIAIPLRELRLTYARAGGPGGQNVNKVATKAVLRFDLRNSPSLPRTARRRALARLASRLTSQGELVLSCAVHREQSRNREAVIERMRDLLADAVRAPKPRVATRPTARAREKRITRKKTRGEVKRGRRRVAADAD